ncbi:ABC transporter substrate-binding protein [Paenibacillus sp. Marseille-Q4541]|uniref:ABC transporter substrate-binding protein n=1 Tax=Paenibacillus sp. Marseille-Q4541 TaxID=2831522 RepID=UPI001BA6DCCE|nr:ABC transporter substrate-binding protein [Paenibacillus sp. Marseille-Q4541]
MKLHSQFLRLHGYYGAEPSVQITLDELALTLECTHRNALNIIRKMEAHGWIEWHAQRGRGKRSELFFRVDPEEIAALTMIKAIDRHEMKKVMDDIKNYTNSTRLPERLQGWLMGYFGHHSKLDGDNEPWDILRLPLRQQIHQLDPLRINLLAESFVSSHVFDSLLTLNVETGEISPHLAHEYEVSEDRKVWTFYLRKDVKFHHGKTLHAQDVIYTFERLKSYNQPLLYHFVIQSIASVTARSSTCIQFTLHQANEYFPSFLCTTRAAIVPSDLDLDHQDQLGGTGQISGTGPFRVTEHNESMCILEAFPDYFKTRPHLDVVEIIQIPWNLPDQDSSSPEGSDPLFPILLGGSSASKQGRTQAMSRTLVRKLVTCNTEKEGPLQDLKIRKKILSSIKLSEPDYVTKSIPIEQAPLVENHIHLVLATIPQYRKDAAVIAAQLEADGYRCRVKIVPVEQFKGPVRMEADLILFSLLLDQDESLRRHDLYLTLSSHVEPALQVMIRKQLTEIEYTKERSERLTKLIELEHLLMEESILHVLYDKPFETTVLPSVRGVRLGSQGWIDLRHIWFPSSVL